MLQSSRCVYAIRSVHLLKLKVLSKVSVFVVILEHDVSKNQGNRIFTWIESITRIILAMHESIRISVNPPPTWKSRICKIWRKMVGYTKTRWQDRLSAAVTCIQFIMQNIQRQWILVHNIIVAHNSLSFIMIWCTNHKHFVSIIFHQFQAYRACKDLDFL